MIIGERFDGDRFPNRGERGLSGGGVARLKSVVGQQRRVLLAEQSVRTPGVEEINETRRLLSVDEFETRGGTETR